MNALTFISLFAGFGGIDLGLERAGMRCVAQVEIDDYATRVLAKHWPTVPRFKDVRGVGAHNLPSADVIAGGFPCQPHSLAGARRASADERDLWGEYARIIGEIKPRWVMAENVPGLLSSDDGRFFGNVLRDLAQLGYDAEWHCLRAADFGAPHQRERIFIIAYPTGTRREGVLCNHSNASRPTYDKWPATPPRTRADLIAWVERQGMDEPPLHRIGDGISARVERLRGLGNAVVPHAAEFVGRAIVAHAQEAAA